MNLLTPTLWVAQFNEVELQVKIKKIIQHKIRFSSRRRGNFMKIIFLFSTDDSKEVKKASSDYTGNKALQTVIKNQN